MEKCHSYFLENVFQFLLCIMNQTFKNFHLQKEKKMTRSVDTFLQLERQLHEDEEFARTLAMLDEEPKNKKVALLLGCLHTEYTT